MLEVDIEVTLGSFRLHAELGVAAGTTLVLVGESGAGKTTLLNLVAGLVHPDRGRIRVGGRDWFADDVRLALPAYEREVAYLFQDYALFPHLSVAGNVAFGLRAQRRPEPEVRSRVGSVLARLGLASFTDVRPAALSGGQRQRVALARALVLDPEVLLLDEPLSALDPRTQRQVRGELRALLQSFPGVALLVTHNPLEALAFGERIAVLEGGTISHLGDRDDLVRHPRSRYVAELIGVNFVSGRVEAVDAGIAAVRTPSGVLHVLDARLGEEVFVAVEPDVITLHLEAPRGTAQNVFRGPIAEISPEPPYGERVRVAVDCRPPLVAEITAHAVDTMGLRPGIQVYASFKASAARAYR